ncbi:Transcriptional regulatory protein YycF [uncultured Collinsella sp.]|nr:Transcriptional regulatory protein YycF [uncultured Collinsella sp.]
MKTRILVVDDEKTITDLVGIYLRNEGYEVQLAYNGADAAQAILTQEFDLAILDIMLPDIDGFELLRTIRTDYTYPVIMLTARDSQTDKIGLFGGFCGRDSGIGPAQRAKTTIWN